MKNLILYLAFTLMVGGSWAQSNLPACTGTDTSRWSDCFGSSITPNGNKYVGEYKDGKPSGQGTYYHLAENQFKGDKYVGEFKYEPAGVQNFIRKNLTGGKTKGAGTCRINELVKKF